MKWLVLSLIFANFLLLVIGMTSTPRVVYVEKPASPPPFSMNVEYLPLRAVQIKKLSPSMNGELVYCSDCETPSLCVGTITDEDIKKIGKTMGFDIVGLPKSKHGKWLTTEGKPCK